MSSLALFPRIEGPLELTRLPQKPKAQVDAQTQRKSAQGKSNQTQTKSQSPKVQNQSGPSDSGTIAYEDFTKLQLRVAVITHAEPHPNADRLLKLTLDAGEDVPRTVCAGIAEAYQPEELIGRRVTLLANLKPRKIRGVVSQGMLLAAGEGSDVRLIEVPEGPVPGTPVS